MGNTIEFPNQEEFYIQKANQCQKEEDLIGAIDWLEKGYIKTNSNQLLEKLWNLLCRSQDWNEIIWLVEEFELEEEKYLSVYIEALIFMNRFEEVEELLNKKSGAYGVSGVSPDFRDIEKAYLEGNKRAILALESNAYLTAQKIAAYMAVLRRCRCNNICRRCSEKMDLKQEKGFVNI